MGFHLGAFDQSQVALTTVKSFNAVADTMLTINGADLIVPLYDRLAGAYAMGATVGAARVTSPVLREPFPIDLEPVDVGTLPSSYPPFHDFFDNPLQLKTNEALNFQMSNGATEHDYGGAWLSDGPIVPVHAKSYPIKTTSSTTLVADAWTPCALTFPSSMPAQKYQVVGGRGHSATGILWRLIFPNQWNRPGAIAFSTVLKSERARFRYGKAGEWGIFDSRQPPQAEFLPTAADTSETVILDVVPLG